MRYLFIIGLVMVGGISGVFLMPQIVFAVEVEAPTGLSPACGTTGVSFAGLVLDWNDAKASDSGTATSAGSNTLTDAAKSWASHRWVDGIVKITGGRGEGQLRVITDNTSSQITIDSNWSINPDNTSAYKVIVGADHYELYYKLETATDWNDKYPSVSQFSLPGLLPKQTYQWYVVSCGNEDCSESATSSVCTFKTKDAGPPSGPVCGNNSCEAGENPISCPQDCNDGGDGGGGGKIKNPISAQNLAELFNQIFSFLFGLAIFIVPVIVIYAAFLMLMGGGDPVKLAKGRMILLWTAVAFIIILLSRGLPVVFKNLL